MNLFLQFAKTPPIWAFLFVVMLLLVGIGFDCDNGYYGFLRVVVFVFGTYVAVGAYRRKCEKCAWMLGFAALLFNPFARPQLDQGVWALLDLAAVAVLAFSYWQLYGQQLLKASRAEPPPVEIQDTPAAEPGPLQTLDALATEPWEPRAQDALVQQPAVVEARGAAGGTHMSSQELFTLDITGRSGRLAFAASLAISLVSIGIIVALSTASGLNELGLSTVAVVAFAIWTTLIQIRRLHDINASAWWILCLTNPLGIVLILWLLFAPGTAGDNRFGTRT